jgi:hypothetical protein
MSYPGIIEEISVSKITHPKMVYHVVFQLTLIADHTLITYPDVGHLFYPSSQWMTGIGPIQQNVLSGLYTWLESHSGLTK